MLLACGVWHDEPYHRPKGGVSRKSNASSLAPSATATATAAAARVSMVYLRVNLTGIVAAAAAAAAAAVPVTTTPLADARAPASAKINIIKVAHGKSQPAVSSGAAGARRGWRGCGRWIVCPPFHRWRWYGSRRGGGLRG
jgi:hypothetical protein